MRAEPGLHVDVEARLAVARADGTEQVDVEDEGEVRGEVVPDAAAAADEQVAERDGVRAALVVAAHLLLASSMSVMPPVFHWLAREAVDERAHVRLRRRDVEHVADLRRRRCRGAMYGWKRPSRKR